MKNVLNSIKAIALIFAFSLITVSCSKESDAHEVQDDSQNLTTNFHGENEDVLRGQEFYEEVEYLSPDHPEYTRNAQILIDEGVYIDI